MELKDPRKIAEELNSSTKKIVDGINKNVKELTESKSIKELVENVQEDFTEIHDLTKKMYENNIDDVRIKVLEKTEKLQEKLQKFHDFVENSTNETEETIAEELTEEYNEDTSEGASNEISE